MNLNTVIGYVGGTGRNQIASQTLASTTETEFVLNQDNASTSIAVLLPPLQTDVRGSANPLDVSVNAAKLMVNYGNRAGIQGFGQPGFSAAAFDSGRPFVVRVAGVVTPVSNAANSLTLKLYSGATKSGTNICSTGALTGTESSTQAGAFILESQMIWDSTGQILYGQFWYAVAAGATASYHVWAVNTQATVTAIANMKFCASAQWGNAAGGVVAVSEFSLSQL